MDPSSVRVRGSCNHRQQHLGEQEGFLLLEFQASPLCTILPLQGQTGHKAEDQSHFMEWEWKWKLSFYILQPGGDCDRKVTQPQSSTEVFLSCV